MPFLNQRMLKLVLGVLGLYALIVLGLFLFQRRFIYYPQELPGPPRDLWEPPLELIRFEAEDGIELYGLYVPASKPQHPTVLIAHGNGGHLQNWSSLVLDYSALGVGALLFDYRGYGWSGGEPTERGIQMDAAAALQYLLKRGIKMEQIVLHGISLGTGVLTPVAARHPQVRALILQSGFTSLVDIAQESMRLVPVRWLLRDRYDNLAWTEKIRCPVLLLHGRQDRLIPEQHSQTLLAHLNKQSKLHLVPGYGHNDLSGWPEYWDTIDQFLKTP